MKENKGITLIALVVTIAVLLILVSVSISILLGDNGLIQKARQATLHSNKAQKIETIQMDIMEEQIDGSGTITMGSLVSILNGYGTIEYNEDGSIKGITTEDGIFISIDEIIKTENINTKANSVYAKLYSFNDGSGDLLELSSTDYTDTADNITLKQDYGNIGNIRYYYDKEKSGEEEEIRDDGVIIYTDRDVGNFAPWTPVNIYEEDYTTEIYINYYYENFDIIEVKIIDEIRPIYTSAWFYQCYNIQKITNCNYIKTNNIIRMDNMFEYCENLTNLDVSNWDISKVTDMSYMFRECSSLKSIDVGKWDTSKVTDMCYMFRKCSSLTSIDVSKYNTSNVVYMYGIFSGCEKLKTITGIENFKMDNCTNLEYMFYHCYALTSLDLSKWNTSKVTDMKGLFLGCNKLTSVDISGWDTSKVTDMDYMFKNCSALKTITIGEKWVIPAGASTTEMFKNCGTTL